MRVAKAVAAALERERPEWEAVTVTGWEEIGMGWESVITAFDAETPGGAHPIVLRSYSGPAGADKARREFAGLRSLHAAGFPVPEVLACEPDPSIIDQPFIVMERVPGIAMWPVIFGEGGLDRPAFDRFVDLAVRLHCLDRRAVDPAALTVADQLAVWRDLMAAHPLPGFDGAVTWLVEHAADVPSVEPTVVHWDYHPDNVLGAPDGSIVAVLDWTQIAVSDPRFDLAWTMLLVGMHEGEAVAHQIRARYEATAGITLEAMPFFEAAASLKRLYSVAVSLIAGPEQLGMHPGAEAGMRSQLEPLAWVYERFRENTGHVIPEVERLLI